MKSDSLKCGAQNAPHRALYHALGLTEEEISRPLVGIVSSYNEIVPGHMNLDKIVDAVKLGAGRRLMLYIVVPVHPEEMQFKLDHGAEALEEKLRALPGGAGFMVDDRRPSVAKSEEA